MSTVSAATIDPSGAPTATPLPTTAVPTSVPLSAPSVFPSLAPSVAACVIIDAGSSEIYWGEIGVAGVTGNIYVPVGSYSSLTDLAAALTAQSPLVDSSGVSHALEVVYDAAASTLMFDVADASGGWWISYYRTAGFWEAVGHDGSTVTKSGPTTSALAVHGCNDDDDASGTDSSKASGGKEEEEGLPGLTVTNNFGLDVTLLVLIVGVVSFGIGLTTRAFAQSRGDSKALNAANGSSTTGSSSEQPSITAIASVQSDSTTNPLGVDITSI